MVNGLTCANSQADCRSKRPRLTSQGIRHSGLLTGVFRQGRGNSKWRQTGSENFLQILNRTEAIVEHQCGSAITPAVSDSHPTMVPLTTGDLMTFAPSGHRRSRSINAARRGEPGGAFAGPRSLSLVAVLVAALLVAGCDATTDEGSAAPSTSASAEPQAEFPLPKLPPELVYSWDRDNYESSVTPGSRTVSNFLYAWAEGLSGDLDLYSRVPHKVEENIVSVQPEPLTPDNYRQVKRIERVLKRRSADGSRKSAVSTGYTQPNYYGGEIVIDANDDKYALTVSVRVVPKAGYLPGFGTYDGTDVKTSEAPHLVAGCDTHSYDTATGPRLVEFSCADTSGPDGTRAVVVTENGHRTDEPGSTAPELISVVHYRADGTAVIVRGSFGSIRDGSMQAPAGTPLDLSSDDLKALAFSIPPVAVE